jgi:hypothetical protein
MLEKDMSKSAGFAFVEFSTHQTAKNFLEALAENPTLLQARLFIIEFAIQDSQKLLKLKNRSRNPTSQVGNGVTKNTNGKHKQIGKDKTRVKGKRNNQNFKKIRNQ